MQLARKDGWTPLHEAAAAGHTEAAKTLISIGASTDVKEQVTRLQCTTAWNSLVGCAPTIVSQLGGDSATMLACQLGKVHHMPCGLPRSLC